MNPNGKGGFAPGETGNAGGRPRSISVLQIEARKHALEAITTLATLMKDGEPHSTRVAACREILDRGFGKAPVSVDLELTLGKKINELSLDELAELERKLAASAVLPALSFDEPKQDGLFDQDGNELVAETISANPEP